MYRVKSTNSTSSPQNTRFAMESNGFEYLPNLRLSEVRNHIVTKPTTINSTFVKNTAKTVESLRCYLDSKHPKEWPGLTNNDLTTLRSILARFISRNTGRRTFPLHNDTQPVGYSFAHEDKTFVSATIERNKANQMASPKKIQVNNEGNHDTHQRPIVLPSTHCSRLEVYLAEISKNIAKVDHSIPPSHESRQDTKEDQNCTEFSTPTTDMDTYSSFEGYSLSKRMYDSVLSGDPHFYSDPYDADEESMSPVISFKRFLRSRASAKVKKTSSEDDIDAPLGASADTQDEVLEDWEICGDVDSVTSLADSIDVLDDIEFEPTLTGSKLTLVTVTVTPPTPRNGSLNIEYLDKEDALNGSVFELNINEDQDSLEEVEYEYDDPFEDEPLERLTSAGSIDMYERVMLLRPDQDAFDGPMMEWQFSVSKADIENTQAEALKNLRFPE